MVEELIIENLTNKKKHIFNMDNANYLLYEGGIDWGSINVEHNQFQYSQQVGVTITESLIGTRDISISGWIIGKTLEEIEKKKFDLSVLINPLDYVNIDVNDYRITGKPSSNVTFSNTYQENNDKMCKFLIQIFCPFPLFKSIKTYGKKLVESFGMFKFPLVLPKEGMVMGVRKESAFTMINNLGSVPVGVKITFNAHGNVNNPTLVNVNTLERIKLNKTLIAGETVEINTLKGERSVMGKTGDHEQESYLDYFDFDNSWIYLPVGESMFTVKSYNNEGQEDATYKLLDVTIQYNVCFTNLENE